MQGDNASKNDQRLTGAKKRGRRSFGGGAAGRGKDGLARAISTVKGVAAGGKRRENKMRSGWRSCFWERRLDGDGKDAAADGGKKNKKKVASGALFIGRGG